MQCLRDAVLRRAVAVPVVAWPRHSVAELSNAVALHLYSLCRLAFASNLNAMPLRCNSTPCSATAVLCVAVRSCAFAAPYISLPLQNNAKRCFSDANLFLSKLRIAIAFHSSAIAWASMAFPLPRLSKQFLRFFEEVSGKLQRVGQLFAVGFGLDWG